MTPKSRPAYSARLIPATQLRSPFAGANVYYRPISLCLAAGLAASDLKIATSAFVLLMLAAPMLCATGCAGSFQRRYP